ncbi:MAG: hypothetical protein NC218_12290, partial [Acetobacter sp.]|nr:hypothetical protein [Acetobacter sp.]
NASIINCYNAAKIESLSYIGGIVGDCIYTTVENCYNKGALSGSSATGGIVATASQYSTIRNCYNSATVFGIGGGGIAGSMSNSSTMSYCVNVGTVGLEPPNSGAIAGTTSGTTYTSCYYGGAMSSSDPASSSGSINGCSFVDSLASYMTEEWWVYSVMNWSRATFVLNGSNGGYPALWWQTYDNWGELSYAQWSGNGNSESTAYIIDTPQKLAKLATDVNNGNSYTDKYFKQTANISLGGAEWLPIGFDGDKNFHGYYDGGNFLITDMYINGNYDYAGLFGRTGNAIFKNITIKDSYVKSSKNNATVGSIVGYPDYVEMDNCHSNARVYGLIAGGLIGNGDTPILVKNCTFSGYVEGGNGASETGSAGGIAGYYASPGSDCIIENCINYGDIKSGGVGGGIVGNITANGGQCYVRNCISYGSVEGYIVGSIVGYTDYLSITNCAGGGQLIFNKTSDVCVAGGLVGTALYYSVTMNNCSFDGSCNAKIEPFVGSAYSMEVTNSYARFKNSKAVYSGGSFSEFTLCSGMNDGLPMQKSLYAVAQFGDSVSSSWFSNNGFRRVY